MCQALSWALETHALNKWSVTPAMIIPAAQRLELHKIKLDFIPKCHMVCLQ